MFYAHEDSSYIVSGTLSSGSEKSAIEEIGRMFPQKCARIKKWLSETDPRSLARAGGKSPYLPIFPVTVPNEIEKKDL